MTYDKNTKQTDYDFETEMELLGIHFQDLSKIRGGPGNPTVNAFEPTYDRHGEIHIIGCDLAQGESMTASRVIQKRIEAVEV